MATRSLAPPRLEKILGHLKKKEDSPWGRLQNFNHRWLTRLETHPLLAAYVGFFRNRNSTKSYLSEPNIDLEGLFPLSFLLHFLLILLLLSLRVAPPIQSTDAPVVVRILDLGPSAAEKKPQPVKKAPAPVRRAAPKAPVTPPSPKPVVTEQQVSEPKPLPAPVLPGPKVLAEIPRETVVATTPESPQSLVQLPTRPPQGGQPSVTSHVDLPQVSGPVAAPARLPEGLRRSESQLKTPAVTSPLAVLSSPDFASYFNMIKQRVESVWKYPDGMAGAHKVNVVFVLDRAGKLIRAEILDSTDKRLNQSALEAMRKASPFPPLPASLKEIAGEPLRIRFNVDFGIKSSK